MTPVVPNNLLGAVLQAVLSAPNLVTRDKSSLRRHSRTFRRNQSNRYDGLSSYDPIARQCQPTTKNPGRWYDRGFERNLQTDRDQKSLPTSSVLDTSPTRKRGNFAATPSLARRASEGRCTIRLREFQPQGQVAGGDDPATRTPFGFHCTVSFQRHRQFSTTPSVPSSTGSHGPETGSRTLRRFHQDRRRSSPHLRYRPRCRFHFGH